MTTLDAIVRAVTFRAESGFTVLSVDAIARDADSSPTVRRGGLSAQAGDGQPALLQPEPERVAAVGILLVEPYPGEALTLHGAWAVHEKYGRQFRIERVERAARPLAGESLVAYLGSGVFPHVGEATARRIVARFGDETEAAMADPARLDEVPGITRAKAERIAEVWRTEAEARATMVFLSNLGISARIARRIWEQYGSETEAVLNANPYRLAWDVDGIGFQRADQIARAWGFGDTSPHRVEAGVIYALEQARMEGHAYLPREALVAAALETLRLPEREAPLVEQAIEWQQMREDNSALVVDADAVYLPALHWAEVGSAARLRALLNEPVSRVLTSPVGGTPLSTQFASIHAKTGTILNQAQRRAIENALVSKISILTGGPGTGKTTTLQALVALCHAHDLAFTLCAPTGRAAKRMSEATGAPAATIHRTLEYRHGEGFTRDEDNPLDGDLVVADEASMIDIGLFYALVRAVRPGAHLLLVGDADQLPSVGPGDVLRDLIASEVIPTTRLNVIYRQSDRSAIVPAAHAVNRGQTPAFKNARGEHFDDLFFSIKEDFAEAATEVVDLAARRLPERFGISPWEVQVLSPSYKGEAGVDALNRALQDALNPHGQRIRGTGFRVGDRVMHVKNDYDKGVFNGDVGRITALKEDGTLQAVMDGYDRLIEYAPADLDELRLGYACTVHKSQGNEFTAVVIACTTQHAFMWSRNLLYTALTRAREVAVLVGTKKALWLAVNNDRVQRRYTRLAERVRG